MKYTDQTRVEGYLGRVLNADEGNQAEDVIEYVSKYISTFCNREWFDVRDEDGDGSDGETYPDEGSTRIFDGSGTREIYIDDFIDLTQIDILDAEGNVFSTYTASTDFQTFPSNKNPKESVRLRGGRFPSGYGNIQITAKWGSGACPQSIVQVATALAGKWFKKATLNTSTFKRESIEGYSYEIQSSADHDEEINGLLTTLGMYKKISL